MSLKENSFKQPKVSIIIVNYNGYEDTIECLKSIRNIDYSNIDVIIVDNASTNNSVKYINDFIEDEILLVSPENKGFSAGNNIGIEYALNKGSDYFLLLNNDTTVEPDFLDRMIDVTKHCAVDSVITCKILYYSDKEIIWYAGGAFSRFTTRVKHIRFNKKDVVENNEQEVTFASGCCMLIPINIIKDIGLLDESFFLYSEDVDYCQRVLKRGYKLIYTPNSKVYHKVSSSTKNLSDIQSYYVIRNKLIIIRKYSKPGFKWIAMIYMYMETVKRLISNEYSFYIVKKAFSDYKSYTIGKYQEGNR